MMTTDLAMRAASLVSGGRGILPLDPARATANAQYALLGIARGEPARRAFRELAITAPGLERYVGGIVLDAEAFRQRAADGRRFVDVLDTRGIVSGVAVAAANEPLALAPGETVVEGLDGLRGSLAEFVALGAGFATLGATFRIGESGTPSDRAVDANAHALARFAAVAQESHVVPIVQTTIEAAGSYGIARSGEAAQRVLRAVVAAFAHARVALDALILQPTMVTPGASSSERADAPAVVSATLRALGATVPVAVAGVAFAAGADESDATECLCALNRTTPRRRPWPLTFAYGAGVREAALDAWRGDDARAGDAQIALIRTVQRSGLAACGALSPRSDERVRPAVPIAA